MTHADSMQLELDQATTQAIIEHVAECEDLECECKAPLLFCVEPNCTAVAVDHIDGADLCRPCFDAAWRDFYSPEANGFDGSAFTFDSAYLDSYDPFENDETAFVTFTIQR